MIRKPITSIQRFAFLLSVFTTVVLCAAASQAYAQDTEATPIVIDGTTPDDGNNTIIVPVPMPDTDSNEPPIVVVQPPANTTYIEIGALLFGVAAVVFAIFRGGNPDQSVTLQLQALQANREAMVGYEARFQAQQAQTQQLIAMVATVVKAIAPLTPIRSDDALGNVLDDIQTPGSPVVG